MNLAFLPRFKQGDFQGIWKGHSFSLAGNLVFLAEHFKVGLTAIVTEYDLDRITERCDGLIVPGSGINIDPTYYGKTAFDPPNIRDEYALDSKVIASFARQNKPMFGICGGLQALNVFFGGTLRQVAELRDLSVSEMHHEVLETQDRYGNPVKYKRHPITVEKDSFVYDVFASERVIVNTYHGWAIDSVAPGFRVVARSDDGIIEAVEWKEKNIFATQWHPELAFRMGDPVEMKFFENFFKLCRTARG